MLSQIISSLLKRLAERIEEVAKMLAGENVTEAALNQARELLQSKEK